MKYGTISSGVEAHSMASVGLGDEAVFFSEIDPSPCTLLKTHYPKVPNLGDMTRVDFNSEKNVIHNEKYDGYKQMDPSVLGFNALDAEYQEIPCKYGEIELVSGGTPCTDCSVAGKRAGATEGSNTRSSLAFQLPRIGKAVGARWIMFENVPGIFSSHKGRDFLWFLYRCMEAGYTLAWRTLDAQFVRSDTHPRAVPQRRRRIWMVGYNGDDWRVPVQALFEPMRVLGDEPPKRVVGKGFTSLVDKNADVNQKSDLEEFKEFLAAANPRIVKFCVDHGLSDPPEQTLKELEAAETSKGAAGGDDMFALFAPSEEKHQGRGLKAADLDLRLPDEADIRKVGTPGLFCWARGVSESIGYCGELFQDWKWKQNLYCEATSPKDVYDGHCGKGAWDKLTADQQKKVFPELTPKAFYDRFHGEGSWDALSDEDRHEAFYESVYKKVKTDEQSVYTLSETARFNIGNAGILSNGLICTLKTPEWNAGVTEEELAEMPKELSELYDGDVCGLCDILEANPSAIYKLSWRACYGICNRAKMRGKKLPIELAVALVERIIEQASFVKWMAINGNKVSKQAGVKSESEIAKIAFDDYIEAEAHWADVTEQQPTKSCELDDIEEEDDDADGDDGDTDEWERVKKD